MRLKQNTLNQAKAQRFCAQNFLNAIILYPKQKTLAQQLGANTYPLLLFLDENGKEFARIPGYRPLPVYLYQIKDIAQTYQLWQKAQKIIPQNPQHPLVLYAKAKRLRLQGKPQQAIPLFKQTLKSLKTEETSKRLSCHYELAKIYYRLRNRNQAIQHAKKVIQLDPNNQYKKTDEMYITLSASYFFQKNYAKAFQIMEKNIQIFHNSPYAAQAYHLWGVYAFYTKRKQKAKQIWQKGIQLYPKSPWSKRSQRYLPYTK
ncbi:MAG: tetratricopeptide repeat protein [Planctomycetota bacterium]|nr:MAG: tetratricopeptide repeat protein [Planctomycetota bacterium]